MAARTDAITLHCHSEARDIQLRLSRILKGGEQEFDTITDITVTTKDAATRKALYHLLEDEYTKIPHTLQAKKRAVGYDAIAGEFTTILSFERLEWTFADSYLDGLMDYASTKGWAIDIAARIYRSDGKAFTVSFSADGKTKTDNARPEFGPNIDDKDKIWYPSTILIKNIDSIKVIDGDGFPKSISWMDDPFKEISAIITNTFNGLGPLATRLENIPRYGGEQTIHKQSVASHSFNVVYFSTAISFALNFIGILNDTARISLMAQYHDIDEAFTGDVSQAAKNDFGQASAKLKEALREITEQKLRCVFEELRNPKTYQESVTLLREESARNSIEAKIVKIADTYDVLHYTRNERSLGNQNLIAIEERATKRFNAQIEELIRTALKNYSNEGIKIQKDYKPAWLNTQGHQAAVDNAPAGKSKNAR